MKKIYFFLTLISFLANIKVTDAQSIYAKYDSLQRILPLQKTAANKIKVLQQLALQQFIYADNQHTATVINYLAQLLELNQKAKVIDVHPYQLLQNSIQYLKSAQVRRALDAMELAIHEFDKQHAEINALLIYIRSYFNLLNDQEGRLHFYQEKLEYYQVNGPFENIAACCHGIAGYYSYIGDDNQSITYFLKAAAVYRKFDPRFYTNEMVVAGIMYADWGNDKKAVYYLKDVALPLAKKWNFILISTCNFGLSKVSFRNHNYTQAINEMDEAIRSYMSTRDKIGIVNNELYSEVLIGKGLAYLKLGQVQPVLPLLEKAKAIAVSGGLNRITNGYIGKLEIDYAFYEYYLQTRQFAQAEKYLQAAIKKAQEEKINQLQLKYLKASADFYEGRNQPLLARKYYHRYFTLLDTTNRNLDKFKIAQYEFDEKNQQQQEHINSLKQEKALQDYQISRRNALLWVSLLVVMLISGLSVFIYRQLHINKKTLITLRNTQQQLIQSEKLASLGEVTAGIAHEIQNPLNFVNNFSEVNTELIEELKQEIAGGNYEEANAIANDIKQNQQKINMHGKRADGIVKGMLEHSRIRSGQKGPTDINTIADECMRISYHGAMAKDKSFSAELVTHFDDTLPQINVVQQDIGRILLNLFNNAFYAVNQRQKTAGEDYKPEVTVATYAENGLLIIKVKDNGVGIPYAVKEKIMQPFFTTKPTGEGTGLGLSLTYDMVVKGHGGHITVNSQEGEFSEFIITLPYA